MNENMYTKHTLHDRLGVLGATDLLHRRLSYAEMTDISGQPVVVIRHDTVQFPNDTSIYEVNSV